MFFFLPFQESTERKLQKMLAKKKPELNSNLRPVRLLTVNQRCHVVSRELYELFIKRLKTTGFFSL